MHAQSPRDTLALQLICDDGTAFCSGSVAEMSETGVFLETKSPLAPGVEVRITPLFPEVTRVFELRGVVVRRGETKTPHASLPGMEIRFVEMPAEAIAQLRMLLARGSMKA